LFVRPKHAGLWAEIEDLPLGGAFDELLERVKPVRVADIMTTDVVTIGPDTHVVVI
jgi:CBS-domain-containing membrane protein